MIGLIDSWDVEYNGTENEARFQLVCDSAAELSSLTHYDSIKIRIGSECTDIATGDKYLKSSSAWVLQPSANAWENVYTKAQVDSMYNTLYQTMLYYHTTQTSTDGTITFYAFAGVVGRLKIYGNGQQTGTPTPDNPITPDFVGTLDGADWTIPISCAGQTVPVYLGQVSTVRRIKKQVLTGTESCAARETTTPGLLCFVFSYADLGITDILNYNAIMSEATYPVFIVSHFTKKHVNYGADDFYMIGDGEWGANSCNAYTNYNRYIILCAEGYSSASAFKSYLAEQYAAGTPVTIWYILATPETAIVNEPLAKIGDYADELHSEDAAVTIPTAKGQNTLTVDTDIAPSKIEISGER